MQAQSTDSLAADRGSTTRRGCKRERLRLSSSGFRPTHVWSVYGAQRARPMATGGKSEGPKMAQTSQTLAVGCNQRPRDVDGKGRIDATSPLLERGATFVAPQRGTSPVRRGPQDPRARLAGRFAAPTGLRM